MKQSVLIHPDDNVVVALQPFQKGDTIQENGLKVRSDIPAGHKIALRAIANGQPVIKYGMPIGAASQDIAQGEHVHTHNMKTMLSGELAYSYNPKRTVIDHIQPRTFMGYKRKVGRAGVRNELWILPTVGCINDVARTLRQRAQSLAGGAVEAVNVFEHPFGCSQMGDDQEDTRTILADLAAHPNAGGVLVIGLGCENSPVESIRKAMPPYDEARVRFMVIQDVDDELATGMQLLQELADHMQNDRREAVSADQLIVGLKCGGSDGLSGITSNPLIGRFSDKLIAMGGSTILTEVPEMFGAETLLMERCETEAVFRDTVGMINGFKRYYEEHNQPIYDNPSPGNKQGGISTLEDKALGCTQKSGSAVVRDVQPYGGRVHKAGLTLLSAPGNDLVSTTALAAAGAQIVLFSTGRGTPFGGPVPTVKIASNSALAAHKKSWIDFDAGRLLTSHTMEQLTDELMDYVLSVASGKPTRNEQNDYRGIAIFKTGVTL
ncbi:MAG TPA: altronate dehydratase family protein [Candidatus Limiplasma sp.]|nr:altronate dehydratase family protein [Candidatus Limiplasma sp.]HRX08133.1 altronate dehydratase family protein [Candidatus Limiplasma sp.]